MAKPKRRSAPKSTPSTSMRDYFIAVALALLLVWLVFLNVSIFRKEQIASAAAKGTQAQLASLNVREQSLQANVNELSTERGQEATLRQTYGVAKPGEDVIVVVPQQGASSTPTVSFWKKWFGWL